MKSNKKTGLLLDLTVLTGLLTLALVPRFSLLLLRGFEILHSDHAVFGLMAKHILEGKPMVYYYGQGYMGSLEAFMGALIFLVRGMDLLSIQLAPLIFYVLFLIVNYYLVKEILGFQVSLMANLLLAISPFALTQLSVTALGGYPETLFFGSLTLLGLAHVRKNPDNRVLPFLTGLAAGIGFWVNNLILMYFLPLGVFCFLGSRLWKKSFPELTWKKILLLEGVDVPLPVRIAVIGLQAGILFWFISNVAAFFLKESVQLGPLNWHLPSPPFHVKKIKKVLWLLFAETAVLSFFLLGRRKMKTEVLKFLPLAGGFLAGALPLIVYSLAGGEGYRVIHGSGIISAQEFPAKLRLVFRDSVVHEVLGTPVEWLSHPGNFYGLSACIVLGISIFLFVHYLALHRKDLGAFVRLRPFAYADSFFPFILILGVLGICVFSSLKAGRYLIPLYFAFSFVFAYSLSRLKTPRPVSWFLLLILLAHYGLANAHFIHAIPVKENVRAGYPATLRLLEAKGIQGGYTHYVFSYVLTYLSGEKIILAPFRSPDRYPPYGDFVKKLERAAYLFPADEDYLPVFQRILDENEIAYEKIWSDPFWVFVIDRKTKSELGLV